MARNVLTLTLDVADLSQLRWAISPAWELLASIRSLADPAAHAVHMPWLAAHRRDPLLHSAQTAIARALTAGPANHLPGFLAPTPRSPTTTLDDELQLVADTPVDVIRREIRGAFSDGVPLALEVALRAPRRELGRACADLRAYWQRTMESAWPGIRALLESDIHHRARALTERGAAAMFADVHPGLSFDPVASTLAVTLRHPLGSSAHRRLSGRGLVLVPSAFAWPQLYVKTAPPWAPVIRYPVRGVGTLWEDNTAAGDLAAALGATRARLLTLLDTPATTDELARRTGLAAGGISAQLHRLLAAGLLSAHRTGRSVLYARTRRADALFD